MIIPQNRMARRVLLATFVLWGFVVVGTGCYQIIAGGLGTQDVTFLTAITALLNIPIAFYFRK